MPRSEEATRFSSDNPRRDHAPAAFPPTQPSPTSRSADHIWSPSGSSSETFIPKCLPRLVCLSASLKALCKDFKLRTAPVGRDPQHALIRAACQPCWLEEESGACSDGAGTASRCTGGRRHRPPPGHIARCGGRIGPAAKRLRHSSRCRDTPLRQGERRGFQASHLPSCRGVGAAERRWERARPWTTPFKMTSTTTCLRRQAGCWRRAQVGEVFSAEGQADRHAHAVPLPFPMLGSDAAALEGPRSHAWWPPQPATSRPPLPLEALS